MNAKILVVDDDRTLTELISYILKREGFTPIIAADGAQGIAAFVEHQPDLVVLDVTMPGLTGFEVCQRLRAMTAATPIIMLTAQGAEEEMVRGLNLGADDYVVKPFQPRAFVARVRANLRRSAGGAHDAVDYNDGYLGVELDAHRVTVNQVEVKLTPTEFKLMAALVRNRSRVMTFRQLLEDVWGFAYIDELDYLRVYIWHLRRKLEPDPKQPIYFLNELNVGYRFVPQIADL